MRNPLWGVMRAVHPRFGEWRRSTLSAFSQENLKRVPLTDLAPTQMTVGMREVDHKRRRWRERSAYEAANFLDNLRIPVVLGPGARPYLLDRHHLALALHNEGVKELLVSIAADMSCLPRNKFWRGLESRGCARPVDAHGRMRSYNDMPATLDGLQDDAFRSLSWAVKKAGGYVKDEAPFSEFHWADFLRGRIPLEMVERDFAHTQALAMRIARTAEAAVLPGWLASADANGGPCGQSGIPTGELNPLVSSSKSWANDR